MRLRLPALRLALVAALCLSVLSWPARPVQAGGTPAARPLTSGVLPVMVLAGQSNMVGWLTNVDDLSSAQKATQTNVLFYGPLITQTQWVWLTPPTETMNRFGPEISLGQHLVTSGAYDLVAQVKYAVGGTTLAHEWNPDATYNPPLYPQMLARVAAAMSALQSAYPDRHVYVAGFFWMQGEGDAMHLDMAPQYEVNLTHFIARLRADLHAPGLPVIVGRVRFSATYAGTVRQAEQDVAANVANVRLVDTDALPLEMDNLHYTSAGIVTLGNDFAASFLEWQGSLNHIFLPTIATAPVAGAHRR